LDSIEMGDVVFDGCSHLDLALKRGVWWTYRRILYYDSSYCSYCVTGWMLATAVHVRGWCILHDTPL
jgi:hypothetical protein